MSALDQNNNNFKNTSKPPLLPKLSNGQNIIPQKQPLMQSISNTSIGKVQVSHTLSSQSLGGVSMMNMQNLQPKQGNTKQNLTQSVSNGYANASNNQSSQNPIYQNYRPTAQTHRALTGQISAASNMSNLLNSVGPNLNNYGGANHQNHQNKVQKMPLGQSISSGPYKMPLAANLSHLSGISHISASHLPPNAQGHGAHHKKTALGPSISNDVMYNDISSRERAHAAQVAQAAHAAHAAHAAQIRSVMMPSKSGSPQAQAPHSPSGSSPRQTKPKLGPSISSGVQLITPAQAAALGLKPDGSGLLPKPRPLTTQTKNEIKKSLKKQNSEANKYTVYGIDFSNEEDDNGNDDHGNSNTTSTNNNTKTKEKSKSESISKLALNATLSALSTLSAKSMKESDLSTKERAKLGNRDSISSVSSNTAGAVDPDNPACNHINLTTQNSISSISNTLNMDKIKELPFLSNPSDYYTFLKITIKEARDLPSSKKTPDPQVQITLYNALTNKPCGKSAVSTFHTSTINPVFNDIFYFRVCLGPSNKKDVRTFIQNHNNEVLALENSHLLNNQNSMNGINGMNGTDADRQLLENANEHAANNKKDCSTNIMKQLASAASLPGSVKNDKSSKDKAQEASNNSKEMLTHDTSTSNLLPMKFCYKINFKVLDTSHQAKSGNRATYSGPKSSDQSQLLDIDGTKSTDASDILDGNGNSNDDKTGSRTNLFLKKSSSFNPFFKDRLVSLFSAYDS